MTRLIDCIAAGALGLGTLAGCGKEEPPAAPQAIDRIVDVTAANFDEKLLKPHLAVLRFYELGSQGGFGVTSGYRELAEDFNDRVVFGRTDIEDEPPLWKRVSKENGFKDTPAFLFYMDGKQVGALNGWPGKDEWLMRMMEYFHHECCKPPK